MTATQVLELNDANFASEVESAEGVIVVDFWASWCMPCRLVAPIMEQLAREYAGRVRFGKLNVDEAVATASAYGIRSIPTIVLFRDGRPVDGVIGAVPRSDVVTMIEEQLAAVA
ncbi:MAG: thioredoxin [Gemmatimonadetes bacterium]|nr:thioredoxin [Gemmatimonadota bacterium]